MNAIDTNIYVYSCDPSDPAKLADAVSFLHQLSLGSTPTVLLWQVAAEYLANLRKLNRRGLITEAEVETCYDRVLQSYPLVLPSRFVLDHSFVLQSRYSLSHWDSLLLAACIDVGVDTLYSEDLSHGMTYDTVKVINPFVP